MRTLRHYKIDVDFSQLEDPFDELVENNLREGYSLETALERASDSVTPHVYVDSEGIARLCWMATSLEEIEARAKARAERRELGQRHVCLPVRKVVIRVPARA